MLSCARFAGLLVVLTGAIFALPTQAQVVDDPNGFSFTVPAGFQPWQGSLPDPRIQAVYVYASAPVTGGTPQFLVGVAYHTGPVIAGEMPDFPANPEAALIRERWQETPVYGARSTFGAGANQQVMIWVDLPLTPQPVRVGVFGPLLAEQTARTHLRTFLASFTGKLSRTLSLEETSIDPPQPHERTGPNVATILVFVLLLGASAFGAWVLLNWLNSRKPNPPPEQTLEPEPSDPPPEPEPEPPPKATVQPPWAVTRDSPGPKADTDVPPWEYKP
jgi:hypothetical protein